MHGDDEELLVPKEEEPPDDADQLHEDILVVEITTARESSRDGHKCLWETDRLM